MAKQLVAGHGEALGADAFGVPDGALQDAGAEVHPTGDGYDYGRRRRSGCGGGTANRAARRRWQDFI